MKKIATFIMLFLAVSICQAQRITPLSPGTTLPLPEHKMKDIHGQLVSIKDAMRKNGVLVMFSCNTCPYVIKNQGRTKMITAFAQKNDVGVILLNSNEGGRTEGDSYSDMQVYAKAQGYHFYYVLDQGSKMADMFGASRTPEVYLFNAGGMLQYKGAIDDNPADAGNVRRVHAREAITEMAGGKEVTVKFSRSLGCGIRRA